MPKRGSRRNKDRSTALKKPRVLWPRSRYDGPKNGILAGVRIKPFESRRRAARREIVGLRVVSYTHLKQIEDEQKKLHPNAKLIKNLNGQIAAKQSDLQKNKEDANRIAAGWQAELDQLKAGQSNLTDKLTKACLLYTSQHRRGS